MLQFAIFFATTRQKDTPESLISDTFTANAKRRTLRSGFLWGRPDETQCNTSWTDNLPGFRTPENNITNASIPSRCTGAGGEIKKKMMDRNGFTAEEATVLIGAHTIGMTRHTFGTSFASPWVLNGRDTATPVGAIFDNAYHGFLTNTIVEKDAYSFAGNFAPFTKTFPTWWRDNSTGINHLDTDIILAFPSLNTTVHPHFDIFTKNFAKSNTLFLTTFFKALQKMSQLGVKVKLFPSSTSHCKPHCNGAEAHGGGNGKGLDADEIHLLIKQLGNSTAFSDQATNKLQESREDEINKLTTPASLTAKPTSTPPPVPASKPKPAS